MIWIRSFCGEYWLVQDLFGRGSFGRLLHKHSFDQSFQLRAILTVLDVLDFGRVDFECKFQMVLDCVQQKCLDCY